MTLKVLGVIPARWASSRFPGKPLVKLAGREMVEHVWRRVKEADEVDQVIVATDDHRISEFCKSRDIQFVLTRKDHSTGSDRLAEVATEIAADIYVNIQGDEPLIKPISINAVVKCLIDNIEKGIEVSTGYVECATDAELDDPSVVHLLPALNGTAIAFSRFPVPYPMNEQMSRSVHVGLYAFTKLGLEKYAAWERGPIEKAESIEIMRFVEHGDRVACVRLEPGSIGVDTPDDAEKVEAILKEGKF